MTDKEVMKLALEALEKVNARSVIMGSTGDYRNGQLDALSAVSKDAAPAITALREALAEQPAPVQQVEKWPVSQDPLTQLQLACVIAERDAAEQPAQQQEPFGYFKAEPFGWTDCAETDDGAIALYTTPQPAQQDPLTPEQKRNLWVSATIELPSQENCYYRGIADSEAYHGIKEKP